MRTTVSVELKRAAKPGKKILGFRVYNHLAKGASAQLPLAAAIQLRHLEVPRVYVPVGPWHIRERHVCVGSAKTVHRTCTATRRNASHLQQIQSDTLCSSAQGRHLHMRQPATEPYMLHTHQSAS